MNDFKQLRRKISSDAASSDFVATVITMVDFTIYLVALFGFCTLTGWVRWIALAVASIMVCALFVVGHDACHRALARTSWLNALIAHIAFMPTLHAQTAWIIGHNRRHHGYTNLRGVDYVWTPWSPQEYRNASRFRRALYRFYRTPIGIGFYYPLEIWLPHGWGNDAVDRAYDRTNLLPRDRFLTIAGFLAVAGGCFRISITHAQTPGAAMMTTFAAVIVPLMTYFFIMSLVIFMHHTHPTVRWFATKEMYDPLVAQMETIHIRLPKPVEWLFNEIFQHTAHHMNPRIPLYRVAHAQRMLEHNRMPAIVQESFSWQYVRRIQRECQLYDFDMQQWMRIADLALAVPSHGPARSIPELS